MKETIKYSIVIAAYNSEKYIGEVIDSVIAQTYPNWELIIINDGSTDETDNICKQYTDKRVSVFSICNKGQIAARKEGIVHCDGDYTLVIDADDYIEPNCLQDITRILIEKDYDCVAFPYSICDQNLQIVHKTMGLENGSLTREELLLWVIETNNHPLFNKVFKTSIIKKGVKETKFQHVSINGDYALIIPIICNVKTCCYIDSAYYRYRTLNNSISHKRNFNQVLDTDYVCLNVVKVLKDYDCFEEKIETATILSYFRMLIWLLEECFIYGKVNQADIEQLRNSSFFQDSKKYKLKKELGILRTIELRMIRRVGSINLLGFFLKSIGLARLIVHRIY